MGLRIWFCMCLLAHCVHLTSSFSGKILYSTCTSINEFDIETRNVTIMVEQGSSCVYAMDYDYKNRFIYFPRNRFHDIVRFAYPSKKRTLQIFIQSLLAPSGIAVDSNNGHIYWIDAGRRKLSRCNLDGSTTTVLATFSTPWAIRLDITNRWMYILDWNLGIFKSRFDLAEQQTIVNFTTDAECIDTDLDEQKLYWINYDGDMKSATDDGSDVKTIFSTNIRRHYHAINVVGSYIYYANDNQLLIVTKSSVSSPTVLCNDTNYITSVFVFNSSGMLITIFNHV